MKTSDLQIVIIGNGVAGNSAASAIRKDSREAAITMVSKEPFPEYSPCVLSKKYVSGEMKREEVFLKDLEDYSRENIKNIFGKAVTGIDIEKKEIVLEKSKIPYDKLIIATGGKPIIPTIEGINKKGVFALKTLKDADSIASYQGTKAVVLGPGFIGVETSIALKKCGWEVSLVGGRTGIILRSIFDKEPSRRLREVIEGYGIKVFTSERPVKIIGNDYVSGVITDKQELDCNMIILALGISPNIGLAQSAGIETGLLGGIKVNRQMMTNVEDVYACGDCVETRDIITGDNILSLLWHNAKQQGEIAGFNSIGIEKNYYGALNLSTVDISGTYAVSIGHTMERFKGQEVRIIEDKGNDYQRLLIVGGSIVGAQLVGSAEGVGPLISSILRRDSLANIKRIISGEELISRYLWRNRLYSCFKSVISG